MHVFLRHLTFPAKRLMLAKLAVLPLRTMSYKCLCPKTVDFKSNSFRLGFPTFSTILTISGVLSKF